MLVKGRALVLSTRSRSPRAGQVGKAIASQTASVGIAIGCMYYFWVPGAMRP